MQAYITSLGLISPQNTWQGDFSCSVRHDGEDILRCIEPEYKQLIPPVQLRRMSRMLKFGLGSSRICLDGAGNVTPSAIVVGTGLACVSELDTFLLAMLDGGERGISPIPFINSSNNTVAAQIARTLKNHSYNNTYCHRGTSFESALVDALMLINGEEARHVLVGGIDEFPMHYHTLLRNIGESVTAGEGAGFFLLGAQPGEWRYGRITAVGTWCQPRHDFLSAFLDSRNLNPEHIDTLLLGINGNPTGDSEYAAVVQRFPAGTQALRYKHLCGEYMTSGSFALALAAHALQSGGFPASCRLNSDNTRPPDRILIFNHYRQQNYSLVLLEKE